MRAQIESMTKFMSALYEGKAQPGQLKDHPEIPVWKLKEEDTQRLFDLSPEKFQEIKEKLRDKK
jgi:hypothetical protein